MQNATVASWSECCCCFTHAGEQVGEGRGDGRLAIALHGVEGSTNNNNNNRRGAILQKLPTAIALEPEVSGYKFLEKS